MALNDKDKRLIEQHLRGKLSSKEADQLEQRIQDPEFASELGVQQEIQAAAQRMGMESLKERLQRVEEKYGDLSDARQQKKHKKPPLILSKWSIAASLLILLVWSFWSIKTRNSYDYLANQFYEIPFFEGVRGEEQQLLNYQKLFFEGNYEQLIQAIQTTDRVTTNQQFLLAHAYFKNNQFAEAEQLLNQLDVQQTDFDNSIDWLLTLSKLKNNKISEAKERLQGIAVNSEHTFQTEAKTLLEQLSSKWVRWLNF